MNEDVRLVDRRLLAVAQSRLAETPVLMLEGPRTVGKSTMLRQLATAHGATVVDLDDLAVRAAVRADPATWVDRPGLVLIDEYQHVPEVLDAIKARLNRSSRPGQFVLTGSAHFDSVPRTAQSLTGRLLRLPVLPLAVCELTGALGLLPHLTDIASLLDPQSKVTSRSQYIQKVVVGGLPLALAQPSAASRHRWMDQYVSLTLARDVAELANLRRASDLPDVLARAAGQTGQIMNAASIARVTGLGETAVREYLSLLEAVFLLRLLPAWGKTLTTRSSGRPKIHVVDSGIAARLLRLSADKLDLLDPTSLTEFGHLVETFAVGELLKEVSWTDGISGVGHWRTHNGDEVDLVLEDDEGGIIGIEVKAGGQIPAGGFRALEKLRDSTGDAFRLGITLYLGQQAYRHSDRLLALPLDRLWTV